MIFSGYISRLFEVFPKKACQPSPLHTYGKEVGYLMQNLSNFPSTYLRTGSSQFYVDALYYTYGQETAVFMQSLRETLSAS